MTPKKVTSPSQWLLPNCLKDFSRQVVWKYFTYWHFWTFQIFCLLDILEKVRQRHTPCSFESISPNRTLSYLILKVTSKVGKAGTFIPFLKMYKPGLMQSQWRTPRVGSSTLSVTALGLSVHELGSKVELSLRTASQKIFWFLCLHFIDILLRQSNLYHGHNIQMSDQKVTLVYLPSR